MSDTDTSTPTTPTLNPTAQRGSILTTAFGTTVAIAAFAYITHFPGLLNLDAFEAYIGIGMIALVLIAGYRFGVHTGKGLLGGAAAGLLTGALLLMIVSAWLSDETKNAEVPSIYIWLPGFLALMTCVMAVGSALGAKRFAPTSTPINWSYRFSWVALWATALLLIVGAVVTGQEAGLSVHGWPDTFGYNMFAYPVSFMTGNQFYEHTHRLFGSLVGLTTLTLAIQIFRTDTRNWLKILTIIAFVMVCVQGYMGGLRVTEATFATTGVDVALAEHETDLSAILRVAHGSFAQIFFATLVVIAAATSNTWKNATRADHVSASTDHYMGLAVTVILIIQLVFGAMVRHLHVSVMGHMGIAMIVFMLSLGLGMRAWGIHGKTSPALKNLGIALVSLVGIQLLLGFGALIVTGGFKRATEETDPTTSDVIVTTLHQANGAALLAVSVALTLFAYRLLKQKAPEQ